MKEGGTNEANQRLAGNRSWSSGICDCCNDPRGCIKAACCPLCTLCCLSSRMKEFLCLPCLFPCMITAMRTKLRLALGIQGSLVDDFCIFNCCSLCAMCQMEREMDAMNIH